ncbi:MAG: hypothetical protein AAGI66_07115 [Cyanobacteria bacterium P01_H01_bin.74]
MIEYVVSTSVLIIASGLFATLTDIDEVILNFFLASSGNSQANVSGSVLNKAAMIRNITVNPTNGFSGMNFLGELRDGNLNPTGTFQYSRNSFVFGPQQRNGARRRSESLDYLYAK